MLKFEDFDSFTDDFHDVHIVPHSLFQIFPLKSAFIDDFRICSPYFPICSHWNHRCCHAELLCMELVEVDLPFSLRNWPGPVAWMGRWEFGTIKYRDLPHFCKSDQIISYIYIHIYHNHQLQALCCETDSCGVSFLLLTCGLYGGSIFPTCEAGRLVGGVNNKCVSVDPSQTKVWYLNHKSMEKTRWDYVTLVLLNNINMFCSIVFWASPGVVTQHSSFITSAPHRLPSQSPCRRGAWSRFGALEGGWLWRIS